jgi:hypothetical protein
MLEGETLICAMRGVTPTEDDAVEFEPSMEAVTVNDPLP